MSYFYEYDDDAVKETEAEIEVKKELVNFDNLLPENSLFLNQNSSSA